MTILESLRFARLAKLESMRRAEWVTSLGVGEILRRFGVRGEQITELDWTESVSVGGGALEITAVPARHFSGRGMLNRFETLWSSFVLKGTEHTVYFGADSGWWEGFAEIGAVYGPFDLTMLEIGAFNELWASIHLGPDGAARAFEALGGSGLMMPIHWGLFDLALHGWRQPIERLLEVAGERGIKVWSPEPGLPTEVVRGVEVRSDWWRETAETKADPHSGMTNKKGKGNDNDKCKSNRRSFDSDAQKRASPLRMTLSNLYGFGWAVTTTTFARLGALRMRHPACGKE